MPIDFSEFHEFDIEKIKSWEQMKMSDDDVARWKDKGVLTEKLYEFKMKKLYLEYLKVKLQNELAALDPFNGYDPLAEVEKILEHTIHDEQEEL